MPCLARADRKVVEAGVAYWLLPPGKTGIKSCSASGEYSRCNVGGDVGQRQEGNDHSLAERGPGGPQNYITSAGSGGRSPQHVPDNNSDAALTLMHPRGPGGQRAWMFG